MTICPFMSRPVRYCEGAEILAEIPCLREKCAAWHHGTGECALIWRA